MRWEEKTTTTMMMRGENHKWNQLPIYYLPLIKKREVRGRVKDCLNRKSSTTARGHIWRLKKYKMINDRRSNWLQLIVILPLVVLVLLLLLAFNCYFSLVGWLAWFGSWSVRTRVLLRTYGASLVPANDPESDRRRGNKHANSYEWSSVLSDFYGQL